MTSPRAQERAEVQRLLRSASHVNYDVAAGLKRHQELIHGNTPVPDWAQEVPVAAGKGLGALAIVGTLGVLIVAGVIAFTRLAPTHSVLEPSATQQPATSPTTANQAEVRAEMAAPKASTSTQAPLQPTVEPVRASKAVESEEPAETARAQPLPQASSRAKRPALQRAARVQRKPSTDHVASSAVSPVGPSTSSSASAASTSSTSTTADSNGAGANANSSAAQPAQPPELEAEQPEVLIEMEQLRTAERLLKTQPQRTLALVRAGFERFRPGYLNQERRYLEVMALLELGKVEDAKLLGRLFMHDYPTGPYRRKVEQALADR